MVLPNKLQIVDQIELSKAEERLSKQKAKQLFDSGDICQIEVGTFKGLVQLHVYLFGDIYEFAGKVRDVNIAKGNFRFVPVMYLERALEQISTMPQSQFNEIIEKYVEMNVAHPFREGNGRTMRIWLDMMLKEELGQVIDWNQVNKAEYLSAMERSVINDAELKQLVAGALTDDVDDRELFMKGIDISYYYEGYSEFSIYDL